MPKYDIDVQLSGQNGNIFNLIGVVSAHLRDEGVPSKEITAFTNEVFDSGSYEEALRTIAEYVNVS